MNHREVVRIGPDIINAAAELLSREEFKDPNKIKEFSGYLKAISNIYNVKLIVALYKSRLTTVYDMKKMTNAPDKETIQDKIITLTTYDLMNIKHKKSGDYWIYRRYWKQQHPNTHSDPDFYIPTENLDLLYKSFYYKFDNVLSCQQIHRLETIGQFFRKFYENQMEQLGDSDEIPELLKRKLIGSCCICGEQLFSTAKHEEFQGELYCQNCVYELYKDRRYLQEKL
jgi:hypothetical protein